MEPATEAAASRRRGADGLVERDDAQQLARKFHWKQRTFDAEVQALRRVQSPWIVRLLAALPEARCCCLELHDADLMQLLLQGEDPAVHTETFKAEAAASLLKALDVCHRSQLVHRDVKPENVLVRRSTPWRFALCDFGRSVSLPAGVAELQLRFEGTYSYAAPEALAGRCMFANDCWSTGVVVFALLEQQMPFDDTSDEERRRLPRVPELEESQPWPRWGRALLEGLFAPAPDERWTATRGLAAVAPCAAAVTDRA